MINSVHIYLSLGFVCSYEYPSLFIYIRGGQVIFLLLYVDDMVINGNSSAAMAQLIADLHKNFKMKYLDT